MASNAQPRAKASSTTPVRMFSFAGIERGGDSARGATSPVANDAATINPLLPSRSDGRESIINDPSAANDTREPTRRNRRRPEPKY
jgi:hypothetical protein